MVSPPLQSDIVLTDFADLGITPEVSDDALSQPNHVRMEAPRPLPQYDLILSSNHYTHRTVANKVFDSEIRKKYPRSQKLNVDEILDDLHEALKPHLGDHVPRPTMWVVTDKVESVEDWKADTLCTYLVGNIGSQETVYDVYQASDKYFIEKEHGKGNGRSVEKEKKKREKRARNEIDISPVLNADLVVTTEKRVPFDAVFSTRLQQGANWAKGSRSRLICFKGFQVDIRRIREWRHLVQLYPSCDRDIDSQHRQQLEGLFTTLVHHCFGMMENRFSKTNALRGTAGSVSHGSSETNPQSPIRNAVTSPGNFYSMPGYGWDDTTASTLTDESSPREALGDDDAEGSTEALNAGSFVSGNGHSKTNSTSITSSLADADDGDFLAELLAGTDAADTFAALEADSPVPDLPNNGIFDERDGPSQSIWGGFQSNPQACDFGRGSSSGDSGFGCYGCGNWRCWDW